MQNGTLIYIWLAVGFFVPLLVILMIFYFLSEYLKKQKEISLKTKQAIINNNDSNLQFFNDDSARISSGEIMYKKIVLGGIIVTIGWFFFVAMSFAGHPGSGMAAFVYLLPVLPIVYIFFPLYFIVLSVKYSREGSDMHILDKAAFYMLLPGFLFLVWLVFSRLIF